MKNVAIATVICIVASFWCATTVSAKSAVFKVTAYCIHGTTASGAYTRSGTIAVDRSVIPFGTKIKVPGYGTGIAQDTGGAIRGNHIDIWFSRCSDAINWGVRYKTITW